ncbi:hypothetical protein [Paraburkholderia sediminicola]|uniref:hypothetical protein n=1 Tax=Paraburkholderia sediminicola TaxID=458836 RepID=UPI0038B8D7CF
MTGESKLGNAARVNFVDSTLEAKNSVLRQYRETGVPEGAYVPRSMTQYRLWENESLGIVRLGSPNSINVKDSEPSRAKLIREASSLIVELRAAEKRPSPKRKPHVELYDRDQAEIRRLNRLVRGMASTIQQLSNDLEMAISGRDQMSSDFANLKREMDRLRRSLNQPSGLRLVKKKKDD